MRAAGVPSPARGTIQHSGSFGACKSAELPKYTATSHHQSYVVLLGRVRNHVSSRRHQSILQLAKFEYLASSDFRFTAAIRKHAAVQSSNSSQYEPANDHIHLHSQP